MSELNMADFNKMAEKFLNCTGQFLKVTFQSEKEPAAKHKSRKLVKKTVGIFRAGVQFCNLTAVKEGIASGERGEVQSLRYGQWLQYPYTIVHNDQYYIRLYPPYHRDPVSQKMIPEWKPGQITVEYTVDGQTVSKEEFNSYLTPSEARKSGEVPECFNVKASNVLSIE